MMERKIPLKRSEDYYIKVVLRETKLKDVMTAPAVTVPVEAHFKEVPRLFQQHNIRHLPVVGGPGRLVGLISQRDLFRMCPPHRNEEGEYVYDDHALEGIILRHVMVQEPFFMYEDDCMGEATVRIVERKCGCIPVVNKDMQVQGIVTQEDILRIAAQIYLE